jgi:WD40 repeat protein
VKLWDAATGRRLASLEAHQHDVFSVACSPDGALIASGDRGGVVMLWDAASGRNLAKIVRHTDMVFGVAFSPDSRYLASGSRDSTALILDLPYFRQHIAGNLAFQLARLEAEPDAPDARECALRRAWAQGVWRCDWRRFWSHP